MQKKANLQTKEILVFCIMSCDLLYAFPIFCVIFSGRMIPHYGLSCAYGNTFRAGAKVLTIVQGQQRSTVSDAGDGKKVETAVVDPQDKTVSISYCNAQVPHVSPEHPPTDDPDFWPSFPVSPKNSRDDAEF
jgi:hypothetical protein